jgi:hypothetical protein
MTPASVDLAQLVVGAITTTPKGTKQLPALYKDGEPVAFSPEEFHSIPFEPSAFNDAEAQRVALCVTPSNELWEQIASLDEWCIKTLSANPTLLGVALSPEQIKDRYVSCLRTSEKGYKTVRSKINLSGKYAVQCYTQEKEKCQLPESWRGCHVQPRYVFRGIWVMGKDMGMLLDTTHVMMQDARVQDECPF